MRHSRLFVTGGTGFIGRALVERLAQEAAETVCLRRPAAPGPDRDQRHIRWIAGTLEEPARYQEALATAGTVVHLAAVTGKARRGDYFRVNTEGTEILLDQCRRAGVRRFLYVSTIAAAFPDRSVHYYYADSKRQAEEAVGRSGLSFAIVRPTVVLGAGSPILKSLTTLARAPIVPVFGDGRARVQPIQVDDVADCLVDLLGDEHAWNSTIELGGPDVLTIEDLLHRIRKASGLPPGHVIHLPARAAMTGLAAVEPLLFPWLPVTAGQLSAFVNDSVASPSSFLDQRLSRMNHVEEMIRPAATHE